MSQNPLTVQLHYIQNPTTTTRLLYASTGLDRQAGRPAGPTQNYPLIFPHKA